jgi:hypothetical protein
MFQFVCSCIHTLNQSILAPSSTQPTLRQSVDSDAGAAHGVENGQSDSNTTTTVLDPADLSQVRPNETTSWWNYVGWTSASTSTGTTASTLTQPSNDVAVTSIQASVANASQELKPTTPSAVIGNANAGSATIVGLGPAESELVNEAEEGKSAEPTEKAKEEVQGGDQPVPISSWYSPWGWYSSTNESGPLQRESESLEVKTISEDPQVDVPLFVSRPEPTSAASSHEGDTTSTSAHPPPPINPITSSMEANWSGWASFFSSRTLMVKTVGYGGRRRVQDVKRDEDGMEVMDLEDDEDVGEGTLSKDSGRKDGKAMPSSPIPIANARPIILKPLDNQDSQTSRVELQISDSTGNKGEQSVSKSPAKSSVSSTSGKENSRSNTPIPVIIPPSSSPSSRDGNHNQSLPTTSKKINNTRTASPAPSKKSVSSQPPLPNLVLPTWEQMFNTAPRNMVPVTNKPERYPEDQTVGGKLLGKTMRFVSGVLFSRDARGGPPESEKQIKGKEREMDSKRDIDFKTWEEERFREFGKELPKSWKIEEAGLDADTTPTSPMGHIPIFGFGSPKFSKGDLRSSNKGSQIVVDSSGIDGYEVQSHSLGMKDVLRGCKRVVVIGIHGWFPGVFSIQISFE